MSITSINPHNGKVIKTFIPATQKEIEKALARTDKAFQSWRETSFQERAKYVRKVAVHLRKHTHEYAKIMTEEMGKPISQSESEIKKCALNCDYFADNAAKFLAPEHIKTEYSKSYAQFDPLGTVLAIMPWNYPLWQFFRFAAPALMAGNTIVLKHASNVPRSALVIRKIFKEIGLPAGVVEVLLIESSAVEALIADKRIAAVTLTGSTNAGMKVAETAGRYLKKCVLELGGSDPFIVLKDANIKEAVEEGVIARTQNAGQSCIAAKRFILEKPIAEKFTKLFIEKMNALAMGDPMKSAIDIGPMARRDLRDELAEQVDASVKAGAKVLCGGKIPEGDGAYYPPTVLVNVKKGMPAYHEEFFGPVAIVLVAKDENDAIRIANDTDFGLGASIWTKNTKKAQLVSKKIATGFVAINKQEKSDPRLPFGGVKLSGYGRELGIYGIREFVNIKTVVVK